MSQPCRRQYLELLTLASSASLRRGLDGYRQNLKYEFIRPPETGLIMVRGRQGNTGALFNIGEMLVTRCAVKHEDHIGQAWVAGRNAAKAELAALGDALAQNRAYAEALAPFFEQLRRERLGRINRETKDIMTTKVNFITMVRGEDKND
ncbi:MAG: phosphonate C-P lyase system protein PhnG [Candidatus Adiutrix sp.]|jgi:alpha-D-ribose 1-methylphosphonate 5-triphosphate synthase subunit PhnG|nr:phosphonate C-P lyase system protein PhnG [Candidatus Adiutrix sp.]